MLAGLARAVKRPAVSEIEVVQVPYILWPGLCQRRGVMLGFIAVFAICFCRYVYRCVLVYIRESM
jgi:hypothetical protein